MNECDHVVNGFELGQVEFVELVQDRRNQRFFGVYGCRRKTPRILLTRAIFGRLGIVKTACFTGVFC